MSCPITPNISSYHDGELPPEKVAEVEAHLSACDECTTELSSLRKMSAAFAAAPQPYLNDMARARILRGARSTERSRQIAAFARPFAAAAAIILAVGLPLLVSAESQGTTGPATPPTWEASVITPVSDLSSRAAAPQDQFTDWMAADLTVARR